MSVAILHRAALGSTASLGTLYDARTDTFHGGISVFKREIPEGAKHIVDSSFSDVQYVYSDKISDKFSRLNIYAELQVSILMGLVTLAGSGSYISDKKQSARSVRSSLVYNIRTKTEKLNIYHEDIKNVFSLDAIRLNTDCTHFVSEIEWGANSMLTCEYENSENEDKLEIGGKLSAQIEYAGVSIKGSASVDFNTGDTGKSIAYKFRVYGDIMPDDELPTTIEAAVNLMKQVPRLVASSNNGKGKPISFTLLPISLLKDYLEFELATDVIVKQVDKSILTMVVQYFEALETSGQLLHDVYNDVTNYGYCLDSTSINKVRALKDNLQVHEATVRSQLASTMRLVRSGQAPLEVVQEFLEDQLRHELSPVNVTRSIEGWKDIQKKMQFARRVKDKGAKYIGSSGSLADATEDNYNGKFFILYIKSELRSSDIIRWSESLQTFFHKIKTVPQDRSYFVIDCAFQPCPVKNVSALIQVTQRGIVMTEDLLEDHKAFRGLPVAQLLVDPKRSVTRKRESELHQFESICPGKTCNRSAVYNWTCKVCGKSLLLGDDDFLYCDCGKTPIHNVSYRCSDPRHGLEFDKHDEIYLEELISTIRPSEQCDQEEKFWKSVCTPKYNEGHKCSYIRRMCSQSGINMQTIW